MIVAKCIIRTVFLMVFAGLSRLELSFFLLAQIFMHRLSINPVTQPTVSKTSYNNCPHLFSATTQLLRGAALLPVGWRSDISKATFLKIINK